MMMTPRRMRSRRLAVGNEEKRKNNSARSQLSRFQLPPEQRTKGEENHQLVGDGVHQGVIVRRLHYRFSPLAYFLL